MGRIVIVGRPETISCKRCNTSVVVKAKGPVPSFCADCRRKRSRNGHSRPSVVACERCGREVVVRARGPLPRFCKNGCSSPTPSNAKEMTPAVASSPAVAVAVNPPPLRPWDRTTRTKPARDRARRAASATTDSPPAAGPAFTPSTVTRIDTVHPAIMVGSADIDRQLRAHRIKKLAALVVWLVILTIIALIVLVGSQPAPPDFDSYARLIA